jgi:plastocyanin
VKRAAVSGLGGWIAAGAVVTLLDATELRADQTVQVGPGTVFSPSMVTVSPGEAVIWNFLAFHTSTSDAATGPEVWDSGFRDSGTFSHTFTTPGTYPFYCQVHSFPGGTAMNGVVQVVGAGITPTSTPIPPATTTPSPTAIAETTPTPTPPESATPVLPGAPIPALDPRGRMLFALALAAAAVMALFLSGRR